MERSARNDEVSGSSFASSLCRRYGISAGWGGVSFNDWVFIDSMHRLGFPQRLTVYLRKDERHGFSESSTPLDGVQRQCVDYPDRRVIGFCIRNQRFYRVGHVLLHFWTDISLRALLLQAAIQRALCEFGEFQQ